MSPDEAAAVLRRAAEIQAARDADALDAAAVAQLGSELGLSDDAVSAALAEHQRRPVTAHPLLGLDADVVVERHVPMPPDAAQAALGLWLRREWMQRERAEPGRTTWRARRGSAADLRRGLDVFRTLRLKGVSAVELRTEDDAGGARVTVVLSLTGARAEALGWLVAFPTVSLTGVAVLLGVVVQPEALLAVPLAGAAGCAGWFAARAAVEARKRQIAEAVEGVLDDLRVSR